MAGIGGNASSSVQHGMQVAVGADRAKLETQAVHGKMRIAKVRMVVGALTGTGVGGALAGTDEVNLIILPANPRILLALSSFKLSASAGLNTTFHLGWRAFTDSAGKVVAEDADGILASAIATDTTLRAWSAGPVGNNATFPVDALNTIALTSKGPVVLYFTANNGGGTYVGALGDTFDALIAYVTD